MMMKLLAAGGTNGQDSCGALFFKTSKCILDSIITNQASRTQQEDFVGAVLRYRWSRGTCCMKNFIISSSVSKIKTSKLFEISLWSQALDPLNQLRPCLSWVIQVNSLFDWDYKKSLSKKLLPSNSLKGFCHPYNVHIDDLTNGLVGLNEDYLHR